jgi:hypothetical protein
MSKQKTTTPESQMATSGEHGTPSTMYIVTRDGCRVSASEYSTSNDPSCIAEFQFWTKVAKKHSSGEKVEIVPYDSKKHRTW